MAETSNLADLEPGEFRVLATRERAADAARAVIDRIEHDLQMLKVLLRG